jgi:signal transduction histidine kinase
MLHYGMAARGLINRLFSKLIPFFSSAITLAYCHFGKLSAFYYLETYNMINRHQRTVTLFQWVWRSYFKASMLPLLVLEIALISVYFLSNQFSTHENIATIRELAEKELSHLATREANGINNQLNSIANATRYLQDYSAMVMSNTTPLLKDTPSRFTYSPEGAYYTIKDNGGSAVFYSGFVPIGKAEREKALLSASLDPVLVGIKKTFPLVAQTYINTFDSLNRIYPYFDVIKQYPYKMDISSFNFYYEADAKHNPKREVVWTDVYIDPAGLGWMTSCIAPVYNVKRPDFLEGVLGVDITIKNIIDEVNKLEIPWHGYGVLISRNGTILALPEAVENDWGVEGMVQSNYSGTISHDIFRTEKYNAYTKQSLAHAIKNTQKGSLHITLNKENILAWASIPETGWKIIIVAPEAHIFNSANRMADRLNQIALLMVIGMLAFYSIFFLLLFRRAKKMSYSISEPLKNIDTIVADIAAGRPITAVYKFDVSELNSTAAGILNMGIQLDSAKQAQNKAVEELRKKSEQLQVIFDVSPSAYVLINDKNKVILMNNTFNKMTGITKKNALTLTEATFLQSLSAQAKAPLEFADVHGNLCRIELLRPRPTTLLCGMQEIYLQKNRLLGKVYFFHDITKNEEIDRIKKDFLTHVTHELRTPLTSILGYSELLLAAMISTENQPDIFMIIHEQADHLVKIINELLDLTKITERAGLDFTILPYSLTSIIEEEINSFIVPKSRTRVVFDKPQQDVTINTDKQKFKQVLHNIIDNAYRYSQNNSNVSLSVMTSEDRKKVEIQITDYGIGMSTNECLQAFDRFYRADKSGNTPGTGLGLSLAKEIVTILDGSICINSTPGKGTRVIITMPLVVQGCL